MDLKISQGFQAANGLHVFGKKGALPFWAWGYKLASALDQLHPGSRQVIGEIDAPREEEWSPDVHGELFGRSQG